MLDMRSMCKEIFRRIPQANTFLLAVKRSRSVRLVATEVERNFLWGTLTAVGSKHFELLQATLSATISNIAF